MKSSDPVHFHIMHLTGPLHEDTTISMGYKDLGVCRLVFRQNPGNSYSDCVVKRRNFSTELLVLLEYLF